MKVDSRMNATLFKYGAVILLIWVVWWLLVFIVSCCDWETKGQIGDWFGPLNALFTGLAFSCVLVTLWQQSQQIAETKTDFSKLLELQETTASELRTSAKIQAITSRIDSYNRQIKECGNNNEGIAEMSRERKTLLAELDRILQGFGH